jgi:hypothetical protein
MGESGGQGQSRLLEEFQQAVEDCQDLYVSCAKEFARMNAEMVGDARREFVQRMIDLSHGLILKIFVEIGYVQQRWNAATLDLAAELFQHIWYRQLNTRQLKEALAHFMGQNQRWDSLLGPFARIDVFRSRVDQLQMLALRLAQIIAKADGPASPDKLRHIQWIQAEMQRILVPLPVPEGDDDDIQPPAAKAAQQRAAGEPARTKPAYEPGLLPLDAPDPGATESQLHEALSELDDLIGLEQIKQEVRSLINFLKMQKAREGFGLPATPISLHSVFSGNPGTGKTTVARLLGRILGVMGVLSKGHLVETDRSGMVAEYVGQTAPRAHQKIDHALDGVLFIDEAYSLIAESGEDPYGAEALQVLLKRMEDDRHRLVVILAGYPEPMERLLRSNPGLSSRFNRVFHFADYTASELGRIFDLIRGKDRYELQPRTRVKLLVGFSYLLAHKDEHFGNGRLVRNLYEQALARLADRIAGTDTLTRELLTTLLPEDIVIDEVPGNVWSELENDARAFRITCPGCRHSSTVPQRLLGHPAILQTMPGPVRGGLGRNGFLNLSLPAPRVGNES